MRVSTYHGASAIVWCGVSALHILLSTVHSGEPEIFRAFAASVATMFAIGLFLYQPDEEEAIVFAKGLGFFGIVVGVTALVLARDVSSMLLSLTFLLPGIASFASAEVLAREHARHVAAYLVHKFSL